VDNQLVVLHRWAEALPYDTSAVPSSWLGSTVAKLHQLWPGPTPDDDELRRAYGVHPPMRWREWIAEAERAGLPWGPIAADALPAVAEATKLSVAGLRLKLPRCVTHRDLNPPNVLKTADGPLLCDFGYAGPDVAWLEAVDAALACTSAPAEMIESYYSAGGLPGPRVTEALARTTGATLMWLAFSMWLSLGHRSAAEERRAVATSAIPDIVRGLVFDLDSLDATAARVFG
jgi:Phosphotransferase enzyme family